MNTKYTAKDPLGAYLIYIGKYKRLTQEQERELADRIKQGDPTARDLFLNANLKLVVWAAKRYTKRIEKTNITFMDLVQEGNIELTRVINSFDPDQGRFSTYATIGLRQRMNRFIQNNLNPIRLPGHVEELLAKLKKAEAKVTLGLDGKIEVQGLATLLEVDLKTVSAIAQLSQRRFFSSDLPIKEGGRGLMLADMIHDPGVRFPGDVIDCESFSDKVQRIMRDRLTSREFEVLAKRFGFEGHQEHTLEEVGEDLSLTKQRILQIQNDAFKKLRNDLDIVSLVRQLKNDERISA